MPSSAPVALRLIGRPDCHLCDEFLEEFSAAFPAIEVVQDDVDRCEDWRARFGRSIPVLIDVQGRVICETVFDAKAVRLALALPEGTTERPR